MKGGIFGTTPIVRCPNCQRGYGADNLGMITNRRPGGSYDLTCFDCLEITTKLIDTEDKNKLKEISQIFKEREARRKRLIRQRKRRESKKHEQRLG